VATPTQQRGVKEFVLKRLDRDELRQLGVILGKLTEECVDSAA
jgi:hypothetical protein